MNARQKKQASQFMRVVGHVVSAITWVWAIIKGLASGNWSQVRNQIIVGVLGHAATEVIFR